MQRMNKKSILGILVLSITILAVSFSLQQLGTMTSRACREPSYPVEAATVREFEYFPSSYKAAREQFLYAVREAGSRIESIENPNVGPDGEPLFMDVASFGATDAEGTLVIISGTHGVEGFAGSGIQTRLLRQGIASRLQPGQNLLMIHAMNPYGMAHLRRFTEDNVDLNRKFRDHSRPYPGNASYEILADAIGPTSISFWPEVASWSKLLWFRATAGEAETQAAVSGGQYSHRNGLFASGIPCLN